MAATPLTSRRHAGGLDVQFVPADRPQPRTVLRLPTAPVLPLRRRVAAWLVVVLGLPLLFGLLIMMRPHLRVDAALLITLTLTMTVAALGGLLPGVTAALLGAIAVNWAFVPPYGTLDVHDPADAVSIAVFVLVGVVVATLVDRVSRGSAEALLARNDAQALAAMATLVATLVDPLPALIEAARGALGMEAVGLFERSSDGGWQQLVSAGDRPPTGVADGFAHPVDDSARRVLVLHGRSLNSNDAALLDGIADQIAVALDAVSLRREAAEAEIIGRADEMRTSILQAVSHDLRTPLTVIKASVTTLLSPEVQLDASDTHKLLSGIDSEVDRLDRVVGNLLDMSRLRSGVLPLALEATPIDEVIRAAADSAALTPGSWQLQLPDDPPAVLVDPALLERALANVLANAAAFQPAGEPIAIVVSVNGERPELTVSVSDRGPGIPRAERQRSLQPFQRLGDSPTRHPGVGLGLAIAEGLCRAFGGHLSLDDTPGGGLTVAFALPLAADPGAEVD